MMVRRSLTLILLALLFLLTAGCDTGTEPVETPGDTVTTPATEPTVTEEPVTKSMTFLFFSDTQPDPETDDFTGIGRLMAEALQRNESAELVVFGGDSVNTGSDEDEWLRFRQSYGTTLDGVVTAAVAGNHDSHVLLAEQFNFPKSPIGQSGGWFYSLSFDQVFFLMLDSNIMGAANQADIDWLENELQSEAARNAHWRVAVMHHPVWPLSDIPKDLTRAETMREYFLPLFEEYGIDMILCGHQHVYSRTQPMRGDSMSADGKGIVQIMAASGDKASYSTEEKDFSAAGADAPNYILMTVDKSSISITAFDSGHKKIDNFILLNTQP